jgi:hypothetical protein
LVCWLCWSFGGECAFVSISKGGKRERERQRNQQTNISLFLLLEGLWGLDFLMLVPPTTTRPTDQRSRQLRCGPI